MQTVAAGKDEKGSEGVRPAQSPEYPGSSRRTLGKLESGSVLVEEVEYAAGLCIARHAHVTPQFIYVLEGTHWSGHGRGGEACAPGTVRFLPAGEPHENYFPVSSRCLDVEVFGPLLELAVAEGALLSASGELVSSSARRCGARLHHELRQNDDVSAVAVEGLLLELLLLGGRTPSRRTSPPAWLLRVREMLTEQGGGRLSLTDLARCAERHPVQISRQFRHHFGCTIGEYVRQARIARAQMLLSSTNRTLAEIALASGFSDQSHFTKAFRRLAGVPPQQYRVKNPLSLGDRPPAL